MNARRVLKWTLAIVVVVAIAGFLAFLYLIPPFELASPQSFISPETAAALKLDAITDEKTRLLAERGKYIVMTTGCIGCHAPPGPTGPDLSRYMAGGLKTAFKGHGTYVTANLTSDMQTGLARRTDDDVLRTLRSGVSGDGGRMIWYRDMPWAHFSNWTEEDRRAVLVYLRQIPAVAHRIPAPAGEADVSFDPEAIEQGSAMDWGTTP
jgi:hypothetical protein